MARSETEYNRKVLQAIASGRRVTQRALSSDLGVALGLTNLLIRRLVAKGYVKVAGMGTRHIRYLMTAAGWEGTRPRDAAIPRKHGPPVHADPGADSQQPFGDLGTL